jgi:hypothetical protein
MKSKLGGLFKNDFVKGFILVILTTMMTIIVQTLQAGSLTFDWQMIGMTTLTAGLSYILKQLGTNSDGKFLTKEK